MAKPIVVGLDPEHADRAPLIVAARPARATGAPLGAVATCLHAPISNAVSARIVDEDLRGLALRGLESLVGDVDLSDRVEVLVCGSPGYGPARSVLVGAGAHQVLRDAHCPVLIAPRGVDTSLEAATDLRETGAT